MFEEEDKICSSKCPHCGAGMKIWKHNLSRGLIKTLQEVGVAIKIKGVNDVHLQDETRLSKNQYNNFQKLRYFGLVHHVKDAEGNRKAGRWLITKNGWDFLKGKGRSPIYVTTYRNRINSKAKTNKFIFEIDPARSQEYFQKTFDFEIFEGRLF